MTTLNPIDLAVIDSLTVVKGDVRGLLKARMRVRCADASEVNNTDFSGQYGGLYVAALDSNFDLDTSDTTSADDGGLTCLIDADGNRFFRKTIDGLGSILIDEFGGAATLRIGTIGTAATPYIDFEQSGLPSLYDARLIATGGTAVNGAGTLQLLGTFAIAPVSGTTQQGLSITQTGPTSGSQSADLPYNAITINEGASLAGFNTYGLEVQLVSGGANAKGQKYGLRGLADNAFASSSTGGDFVGVSGWAISNQTNGGSDTGSSAHGTLYGMEATAWAFSGALNYFVISGGEANANINSGASAKHRWGWSIVGNAAGRGASSDAALEIGAATSTGAFTYGILLDNYHGQAPLPTTGVVLGTDGSANTITTGIDLSSYTITGNFLKGPNNFIVTGAGAIFAPTLALAPSVNSGLVLNDGTVNGVLQPSSLFTHSLVLGTTTNHPLGFLINDAITASLSGTTFTAGTAGAAGAVNLIGASGAVSLFGSTSGTVTVATQAAAGTYNFNLPTTAGAAGQALLSGGGGSSPMTFGTLGAAAGGTGLATLTAHAVMLGEGTGSVGFATIGTAGRMLLDQGASADPSFNAMSGDATLSNAGALTLASVITAGGPTGSATIAPIITYDAKGRLTAVTTATITPAVGSVTGLGTGVATALGVNIGSAGAPVTFGGALGSPSSVGTLPAHTLGGPISGGGQTITNLASVALRDTSAAFDVTFGATSSTALTAGRALTIDVVNGARTLKLAGGLTIASDISLPAIAQGDLWYGSATGVKAALAKSASANRYLANTGASNNPAWDQVDLTNGVKNALPVANGGTGDTGTAWTAYTPTITTDGGNFTTASTAGRYKLIGKTCFFEANVTVTTVGGSASGAVRLGLPVTAGAGAGGYGYTANGQRANDNHMVISVINAASAYAQTVMYDGTSPVTAGLVMVLSGQYETA